MEEFSDETVPALADFQGHIFNTAWPKQWCVCVCVCGLAFEGEERDVWLKTNEQPTMQLLVPMFLKH